MNSYQRIFGTGPRGAVISVALLVLTGYLEPVLALPVIHGRDYVGGVVFIVSIILTIGLIGWSVKSLPPNERGRKLVTEGAFKWFRHPLYGAFLLFFNFGLALLLDNWIYLLWAVLQFPVWHLNIAGEEALVRDAFGEEYDNYCRVTGRFFPRIY